MRRRSEQTVASPNFRGIILQSGSIRTSSAAFKSPFAPKLNTKKGFAKTKSKYPVELLSNYWG